MGQGRLKELVKAHGNAKLENGPRIPKESKWADNAHGKQWVEDAQGERNGPKEPKSNIMGQESPK